MKTMSKYFILCIFAVLVHNNLHGDSEWTNLVYVQAKNNLSPFALKNFSDMASIGSNENTTTLVQWYQPGHQGVWRYKIEKGKMVLDECNTAHTDGNSSQDLVDAMRWAVTRYPAKKYSLVLWDHGIGIVDPIWGRQAQRRESDLFAINQTILNNNPRIQIDGITIDSTVTFSKPIECALSVDSPRGILFNEESRTYMNNQTLAQALTEIKTKVLKNKKIDLLGMDACLMAMVEIGYLARDCADILVASQEVELAHGWDYAAVTQMFSMKDLTAMQAAQGIVECYQAYYKNKIQFYTQSAINLDLMPSLKQSIDNIVTAFRACVQQDRFGSIDIAKKARRSCLQFSTVNYIDLHTFYVELSNQISNTKSSNNPKRSAALNALRSEVNAGMKVIDQVVIASAAGTTLARAKGLSIYFPIGRIDASYQRTDFAKDCLWYGFIKELTEG